MDKFPFTLEDAMKAADAVRQICNEKTKEEEDAQASAADGGPSSSWNAAVEDRKYYPQKQFPPGAMEGVAAAAFSGLVVFLPFRNAILRQARRSSSGGSKTTGGGSSGFSDLVDLMIAPLLAVGVAQVGLATASLAGSQVYLSEVANVPPTSPSPMTDLICSELLLIPKENGMIMSSASSSTTSSSPVSSSPSSDLTSSWDPRVQTLYSLSRAIETCEERDRQQRQLQQQIDETNRQNETVRKHRPWSMFSWR